VEIKNEDEATEGKEYEKQYCKESNMDGD